MTSPRTVAIVGAGVSGITATKACLEEGLEPVCYEQFDYVGGLWHHTEDCRPGQGAVVYESLVTNTSKSMTCFSDMPFPPGCPQYQTHEAVCRYLESYVRSFGLDKFIRLKHAVVRVVRSPRYEKSGSWLVTVKNLTSGNMETQEYDGVIVCNGRQRVPHYPTIPGLETFEGQILHAISYRNPKCFADKRVLVVGNANSAGDLSEDACSVAKSVYLSTGRGTWITQRIGKDGISLDSLFRRILSWIPVSVVSWLIRRACNKLIDHIAYSIASPENKGPLYTSFLVNETLADKVREKKILMKPYVTELNKYQIKFSDGSLLEDVDLIMFATGYSLEWNFLSKDILSTDWNELSLYKLVWPENLVHHSLAVVGCMGVRGPVIPVLELQSRWAAAVLSGRVTLPSRTVMLKEIHDRKKSLIDRYGYLKVWIDSLPYQDSVVAELDLKPSLIRMLCTSPKDVIRWYMLPSFPMLYRLYGKHAWSGARQALDDAILEVRKDQESRKKAASKMNRPEYDGQN